jgi:KaiC/GvpD/RAD55 family RecA-like ATPase
MEYVKTGISGLDKMLLGGIPRGFSVLVEGNPGCGKTILGIQFLFEGIKNGEKGIYLSFEVSKEKLVNTFSSFTFDIKSALAKKQLIMKFFDSTEGLLSFEESYDSLVRLITSENASRIVFDSITMMSLFKGDTLETRRELLKYTRAIEENNCTGIFILDRRESALSRETSYLGFLFDGVIRLGRPTIKFSTGQMLQVIKMRGTNHDIQPRLYKITNAGISVTLEDPTDVFFRKFLQRQLKRDTSDNMKNTQ